MRPTVSKANNPYSMENVVYLVIYNLFIIHWDTLIYNNVFYNKNSHNDRLIKVNLIEQKKSNIY